MGRRSFAFVVSVVIISLLFHLTYAAGKVVARIRQGFSEATQLVEKNIMVEYLNPHVGSATAELMRNPVLSTPADCARACKDDEPPRICYYHFTLEHYTTVGAACQLCTPGDNNTITSTCQCVLADGVEKGILTANRMIPGPSIQVCENDTVVIDVENDIEGKETTIHWHGILQKGSQYYDGVPYVTQCPIQKGNTFRYKWIANAGTFFWHSHAGLQKMNGLHGSLIVRQPPSREPQRKLYDYDLVLHVIVLTDLFHEYAEERYPGRLTGNIGQSPDSIIINGKGQYRALNSTAYTTTPLALFTVTAGKRYRFRLINAFSSVCPARLTIEGHNINVIAADGDPIKPVNVTSINSFTGERYDFIVDANKAVGAYWIQVRGLGECGINRIQQHGILRYANGPYDPPTLRPEYDTGIARGRILNPLDSMCSKPRADAVCVNQLKSAEKVDPAILRKDPDVKIFLPFRFYIYDPATLFTPNIYNRFLVAGGAVQLISLVDEISNMLPPQPLISQFNEINPENFCNGDDRPAECAENCMCTHMINIPLNALVEIILVDEVQITNLSHPFHLHGYSFHVIGMGRAADINITTMTLNTAMETDRKGKLQRHLSQNDLPPKKDTLAVPNNGYTIVRFIADNPGFWLFHCHFLYHLVVGMSIVLQVGNLTDLPPVPPTFPRCGDHLPPIY